ncbi:hypothetical protein [Halalkalibacter alkaliphilus]|uniref:Uncharacterized protein n=1 Tax=Halalkalibacter alkaliphilus TaxID=2917993 RepID=A0A9X2I7V2_9BACI|nr:hypothetical protein [Halalkalibacter alkaliphilus]MCL7749976.1 hypothetical protein [Halalkalibacter alkaliphilus]
MCVLCGEFVMQIHWTDQTSDDTSEIVVGDLQRERQRTRIHRTHLCNEILQFYRLKLEEWNGSKFILSDSKGNQEVVHDLGTLWQTAEKLLGYPVDPLDSYLLEQLRKH